MSERVRHLFSSLSTIYEAAHLVRHSIERILPRLPGGSDAFDFDNLQGACGIASYCLRRVLKCVNIKSDFVVGHFYKRPTIAESGWHCWVEIRSRDMIVDLTATQFDVPSAVHVTDRKDMRYFGAARNRLALDKICDWECQSHVENIDALEEVVTNVVDELVSSGFVQFLES